jgi:small subunit ribosomal protein S7
MPRRREIPKREILPDPKHKSEEVAKFMNVLMTRGKKSVAERILYGALDTIAKKSGKDAFEVFNAAINNVKPMVEVKSRRVGGANYQVPSRSARCAAPRFPCAGSARLRASVARRAWRSAWPTS